MQSVLFLGCHDPADPEVLEMSSPHQAGFCYCHCWMLQVWAEGGFSSGQVHSGFGETETWQWKTEGKKGLIPSFALTVAGQALEPCPPPSQPLPQALPPIQALFLPPASALPLFSSFLLSLLLSCFLSSIWQSSLGSDTGSMAYGQRVYKHAPARSATYRLTACIQWVSRLGSGENPGHGNFHFFPYKA